MTGDTSASGPGTSVVKFVVAGAFGAGKTTFIRTIADGGVVETETFVSEETSDKASDKTSTTVAMDFGRLAVEANPKADPVELMLFGLPGQRRFQFMWHILARGALGYVLLVDASDPESWFDAVTIDATLLTTRRVPRVVAVNRATPDDDVAAMADVLGIEPGVPIVSCDPRDRASVVQTLLVLMLEVARAGTQTPAGGDAAVAEGGGDDSAKASARLVP